MTSVPSIVQFDRVSFAYPARAPVLQGVSFDVPKGDLLALVGRSGAGKSTILKLVNRLLLPQSGRVEVEGRDTREWSGIPLRRRIGYVLQDVGLFPHMLALTTFIVKAGARGLARSIDAEVAS